MEAINYFRKKLYRRSLTRFRMCLWKLIKKEWCRKCSKMSEVLPFWQSLVTQKSQIVWFFCYIRQTSLTSSSQQSKNSSNTKIRTSQFSTPLCNIQKMLWDIYIETFLEVLQSSKKIICSLNFVDILGKGPDQVNLE